MIPSITLITANPILAVDLLNLSVTYVTSVYLVAVIALVSLHIACVAILAEGRN